MTPGAVIASSDLISTVRKLAYLSHVGLCLHNAQVNRRLQTLSESHSLGGSGRPNKPGRKRARGIRRSGHEPAEGPLSSVGFSVDAHERPLGCTVKAPPRPAGRHIERPPVRRVTQFLCQSPTAVPSAPGPLRRPVRRHTRGRVPAPHLADLGDQIVRDLVRGIYPPLFAEKGLPTALQAQARKAAVAPRMPEPHGTKLHARDPAPR
jgi:hypothetical protein